MQLPRMTTRRWMIGVAVLAAIFWPGVMIRRARAFRKKAATYAAMERAGADGVTKAEREKARFQRAGQGVRSEGDTFVTEWAEMRAEFWTGYSAWSRELMGYGAAMRRKYERAGWHPWVSVTADPPAPPLGYPNEKHAPITLRWSPAQNRKRL